MEESVALALDLVRFDTISPPGTEEACAAHLAALLREAGLAVTEHAFAPGRTSLIARLAGTDAALAPLVFTGHLDTVPLGSATWSVDPFGEIRDGRLYGRGTSDMKAGVAAFVAAVVARARTAPAPARGITLVLTAGEETGCRGAADLARQDVLAEASGLVVAEPTANRLALAHKGALHLRARTRGATAHGSMPDLGDNAVLKATRAAEALRGFAIDLPAHPLLGAPTLAVTSLHGGEAVNVIPDSCTFTLDLRTLPGQDHAATLDRLREAMGPEVALDPPLADLPAVGTAPDDPFATAAARIVREVGPGAGGKIGEVIGEVIGLPYFTDGSVLQGAYGGCPTVILGPGEPGQAHQTDEWCATDAIVTAERIYAALIRDWCR
ncbi:M20 family metallopeptidase [Methylobacterium oryzisoli]|uniref:M20 family metallopeptidase n=1 Tax=Methylobacterium oryzisoli TaxID=3385502 RepID=UPI003892B62E